MCNTQKTLAMGACGSRDRTIRVLLLGLDGAGKTTLMYQLMMGETIKTVPTCGEVKMHARVYA